jgi:hypothetical protein
MEAQLPIDRSVAFSTWPLLRTVFTGSMQSMLIRGRCARVRSFECVVPANIKRRQALPTRSTCASFKMTSTVTSMFRWSGLSTAAIVVDLAVLTIGYPLQRCSLRY